MGKDRSSQWRFLELQVNGNGQPYPNVANAAAIMRRYKDLIGAMWFDTFYQRIRTDLNTEGLPRQWTDADTVTIVEMIQRDLAIATMPIDAVRQAVLLVAHERVRSEPREWLNELEWDGATRLPVLMSRGFGAEDTDFNVAVGENLMMAMVARVLDPGCKYDNVPILEGEQGIQKSTALQALGGPYFGEVSSRLGEKDLLLEMQGKMLIEISDLHSLHGRAAEQAKAFFARQVDNFRTPYGHLPRDVARTCTFIGTTNEDAYLEDDTGNRRYWPVRCGRIDVAWIAENREQLFAEARDRLAAGEPYWIVPAAEAKLEQARRHEGDPWEEPIAHFLEGRDTTTMDQVLNVGLKIELGRQSKADQRRAGAVMRQLGWYRHLQGLKRRRSWRRRIGSSARPSAQVFPLGKQQTEPYEPDEPMKRQRLLEETESHTDEGSGEV